MLLKCILGHLLTHHTRFESNMADTDVISGSHYPENLESMYFRYFSSNLEDISGKSYVLRVKKFIYGITNKLWSTIGNQKNIQIKTKRCLYKTQKNSVNLLSYLVGPYLVALRNFPTVITNKFLFWEDSSVLKAIIDCLCLLRIRTAPSGRIVCPVWFDMVLLLLTSCSVNWYLGGQRHSCI